MPSNKKSKKKKKQSDKLLEAIADFDDTLMFADGFDDCVLGVIEGFNTSGAVVYDLTKVIQKLSKDMGMEDAWEYYRYNIKGSWIGDSTPMYMIKAEDL